MTLTTKQLLRMQINYQTEFIVILRVDFEPVGCNYKVKL